MREFIISVLYSAAIVFWSAVFLGVTFGIFYLSDRYLGSPGYGFALMVAAFSIGIVHGVRMNT